MNLPEKIDILVITLSDRASLGEYPDLSGPRVKETISEYFSSLAWKYSVDNELIPDSAGILREILLNVR